MCTVPEAINRPKKHGKGIIAQENHTLKPLHVYNRKCYNP